MKNPQTPGTGSDGVATPPVAETPVAETPVAETLAAEDAPQPAAGVGCPTVGIGASAGGLEALETFFGACPPDTGIAFVLVPHLDPDHSSLMTEILQRCTAMTVSEAVHQERVEPNHVYIIPPSSEMAIVGGVLQLSTPVLARGHRRLIDSFLRSLAADKGARAMGVILSGTGSDGTLGLRAILAAGGACIVQDPANAKFDGMPQNAISAGYATHILRVDQIPAMLQKVASGPTPPSSVPAVVPEQARRGISQILLQLRSIIGHDFTLYKKSTMGRRIQNRMAARCIEDESAYAGLLREDPLEASLLFQELLINVTSFFRDPEAFVALKQILLPVLLAREPTRAAFRVWVAGCSTGEEAYSIAIVLRELQDELRARGAGELQTKIYATDLDDDAIAVARVGHYSVDIARDILPERLQTFFSADDSGYRIKPEIRNMVVFAVHDVIQDPPFVNIDLLSCRNLLIYFEAELQNRLVYSFHFALKPDGILFLSTSESLEKQGDWFGVINDKWKLYRAHPTLNKTRPPALSGPGQYVQNIDNAAHSERPTATTRFRSATTIAVLSTQALLEVYAPASVITDCTGNILYVHGDTGRYLRPAPGTISSNVVSMAREGLQRDLRAAISSAAMEAKSILKHEVSVKTNGSFSRVSLSVRALPSKNHDERWLLVSFEDVEDLEPASSKALVVSGRGKRAAVPAEGARSTALERELNYSREVLQSANEELQTYNEELQSANEELQSANEELESSREELRSLNEEATSANSELTATLALLQKTQNDMKNLLNSIDTGIVFLTGQMLIRSYTPKACLVYRLIGSDIGRPLSDITTSLDNTDLTADLRSVFDTMIPIEREVHTVDGSWYLARIQPYRTVDNIIDGVVLTFTAVTEFKRVSEAAQHALDELDAVKQAAVQVARELAEGIVNTLVEPLLVLDNTLQVVSASRAFYAHFKVRPAETVGRKIYDLGNGQWNIAALRQLLEDILPHHQTMEGYVVEHNFAGLGPRRMVLNARRIVTAVGDTEFILLVMAAIEPL